MVKKADLVGAKVLVATESFVTEFEGASHAFHAGVTRVREGHPILKNIRGMFKEVDAHYEVEQATAAPGEVRGG